uniref:Uncharacterized protein AlNc14C53G4127 n=1 Tax=Albugo laibachii Nc14 TaxID=890382 RepID=F0WBT6_9STRA|nr:conserved hypothetical protein [Albugo laibachii Nc14]CCA20569.1 conserved hypothetical protein [Albugo laibachii Nc14]|eukprot:CCA20569.1 conserved hypothetical protein [Albugo laibachii Nc14]
MIGQKPKVIADTIASLMTSKDRSMRKAADGTILKQEFAERSYASDDDINYRFGGKAASNRAVSHDTIGSFDAASYFIKSISHSTIDENATDSLTDTSPPIPFGGMISAEEVIRESFASTKSGSLYRSRDDFSLSNRSDSVRFSLSTRSTFRRSTISEQMLRETELFEPEREVSMHEISEALSTAVHNETKSIEVTSIKEEEQTVKREHAKYRWAQHVKLKARNLFFTSESNAPNHSNQAEPQHTTSFKEGSKKVGKQSIPKQERLNAISPGRPVPVSSLPSANTSAIPSFAKWNQWMQDQYQSNIANIKFPFGTQSATISHSPNPMKLISIEEIISNSHMMRYFAAWLKKPSDHSKLFFLCSYQEYRHFWCTLRANFLDQQEGVEAASAHDRHHMQRSAKSASEILQPFSRDDILLLRTYGVKIAQKYLSKSANFHVGHELVDSNMLRSIKRDIAAGGEDALRTFDNVSSAVKQHLMQEFPEFRNSDLYTGMIKTVPREVIFLEDILMNHRFANFFWIFLFPHNYHREVALWIDIEYEFKPAYRLYVSHLRNRGKRSEKGEVAAHRCRKLVRYIVQKYYAGDPEMQGLEQSLTNTFARLQQEQDAMLEKFGSIHLELYHRFLTSRAYAEFSLYASHLEVAGRALSKPMDDFQRLASLLLDYGLRAHTWPEEMSRDVQKKRALEVLLSARGYEAISGVLTFDTVCLDTSAEIESTSHAPKLDLRITQHPLPHDPQSPLLDKMLESFLLAFLKDPQNVLKTAPTCPPPFAFNFRMGDSSSSTELYAASLIMYKPAPMLTLQQLEHIRLGGATELRWIPYGVCITSKFALVDLLRERLAEAYEYIVAVEALESISEETNVLADGPEKFPIDKSLISKLSRTVRLENPVVPHSISKRLNNDIKRTASSTLSRLNLPLLDHSVRLLFDIVDIQTILVLFAAVLLECRVLFMSSHISVLMKVGESIRALMYPLLWPHVYLPVLPSRMLQYLECPTPFIFGVLKDSVDASILTELTEEDILILDLDMGIVEGRGSTIVCALPKTTVTLLNDGLYELLKPNMSESDHVFSHQFLPKPAMFPDYAVRQLFQDAVQDLISDFGYHRYLWTDELSKQQMVFFDEASYLAASSPDKREFLSLFIATQAFSELMVSFSGFEDVIAGGDTGHSRNIKQAYAVKPGAG